MPKNLGSTKDLSSKNILSRHTEFCKANRTTRKLTMQDINTTPKEPKTSVFGSFGLVLTSCIVS